MGNDFGAVRDGHHAPESRRAQQFPPRPRLTVDGINFRLGHSIDSAGAGSIAFIKAAAFPGTPTAERVLDGITEE